jgi:hypothetical protein
MYTLLVTNVPGPQFPLYLMGRELLDVAPVPFLGGRRALAVAIMSYNGRVDFGLLGDYDALPDLDVIVEALADSVEELRELANRAEAARRAGDPEVTARATVRAPSNGHTD